MHVGVVVNVGVAVCVDEREEDGVKEGLAPIESDALAVADAEGVRD